MDKQEFSTGDVSKMFGVKLSRLQVWRDQKYIRASVCQSSKQGERNRFGVLDLYQIGLFVALMDAGVRRREASVISRSVCASGGLDYTAVSLPGVSPLGVRAQVDRLVRKRQAAETTESGGGEANE